jgi:hypothetical protein
LKALTLNINVHHGHLFAEIPTLLANICNFNAKQLVIILSIFDKHTLLSILVTNTLMEPFEGWLDNSYNITRILRTAYLGYDRVGICNVDKVADIVPADMCVNAMVAVARETAKHEKR